MSTNEQDEKAAREYAEKEVFGDKGSPGFKDACTDFLAGITHERARWHGLADEGFEEWANKNMAIDSYSEAPHPSGVWFAARVPLLARIEELGAELLDLFEGCFHRDPSRLRSNSFPLARALAERKSQGGDE